MLFRFRVSNFRSLRQEQELSFIATSLADLPGAVAPSPFAERGVLRAAGIYGANASGKTNVLRAVHFMATAVQRSQRSWEPDEGIPREEFALDAAAAAEESLFEADFALGDVRYQYGFVVDDERVRREWLFAFPTNRRQVWFERDGHVFEFGKKLSGENRRIERLTRTNSLFLSAAAQNNHELLSPLYRWFARQWHFIRGSRNMLSTRTAEFCIDEDRKTTVERLLQAADLGIVGFDTRVEELPKEVNDLFEKIQQLVPTEGPVRFLPPTAHKEVTFKHTCSDNTTIALDELDESDGTMTYFGLLGPVLETLENGGILAIDEISSNLHPLLALELVRMFNSSESNRNNAQLIFNTHDTSLLDPQILRRDQVWFTEKDDCGATHLYALTDFKPRRGENIKTGYLQGRYGAVPFVDKFAIQQSE